MLGVNDVQEKLADLRDEKISLADLERWIQSTGWNLHKKAPADSRVYKIVREIQGYLSEFHHAEYNETELRHALFSVGDLPQIFSMNIVVDVNRVFAGPNRNNVQTEASVTWPIVLPEIVLQPA